MMNFLSPLIRKATTFRPADRMTRSVTRLIHAGDHWSAATRKDRYSKKEVAYVLTDRSGEWTVLCHSIPRLAQWVNEHLSCGDDWDRVSVTGLWEALNKTGGRHGGWHKGRFRVRSVPLQESGAAFDDARSRSQNAAVVACNLSVLRGVVQGDGQSVACAC